MKNLALIPLRSGSKTIPGKNIKIIAGKPLCAWVIEAAEKADIFYKIIVSTESAQIADTVKSLSPNVEILKRPDILATDEASTEAVMLHTMDHFEFDVMTTIQATSPLICEKDLVEAFRIFTVDACDSLLTAVKTRRFFWSFDNLPLNYNPLNRPRRQDYEGIYMENGAFYITSKEILKANQCRLGGKIGIYEMAAETAVEIDDENDWATVEFLLNKYKNF
jgi:N-acylneuraminate cytidylyltransferase